MFRLLAFASLVIHTLANGYSSGNVYSPTKTVETGCSHTTPTRRNGVKRDLVGPVINGGQVVVSRYAVIGSEASATERASSFDGNSLARAAASARSHFESARASALARANGVFGTAGAPAQAFRPGFVNQFVYQSYRPYHYYSSQYNPYFYSHVFPLHHGYGQTFPYSINFQSGNRARVSCSALSIARGFNARSSARAAAAVGSGIHGFDGKIGSGSVISDGQQIIGVGQIIGDESHVGEFNGIRRRVIRKVLISS